jgi:hypothetical protein
LFFILETYFVFCVAGIEYFIFNLNEFQSPFGFALSVSFYQCSVIIVVLILLLSEGQAGEAWGTCNNGTHFQIWGNIGKKVFPFSAFKGFMSGGVIVFSITGSPCS